MFYVKAMIFMRFIVVYVAFLVCIALTVLRHMLHHYQTISSIPGWAIGLGLLGLTIIVVIGLIWINRGTESYEKQHPA
ncbi:hypothetical protein [Priestia taiwanensis]|uniref:Uncharacterized protein n=1 Tax=Priestia taiwanensis TaxID=1347902 RepID=A0A917ATX0_9BACI|nr:hypothetical protein [Priestia taiwanensis]MBM7363766.1 protein-S-isoprenylcysteine O-methyltransferase Ste14 [Priestia taiwanensis]GGE74337.1 hypothetical protein GCM10007140_25200 [Priestia taiwanensis]